MRFSGVLKSAFFAGLFVFAFSNAYGATCPSGYQKQTNVFENVQHCGIQNTFGYEHTGTVGTNSPISTGDGTWVSYFPSFRVKGRAYCSTTAPGDAATGVACTTIPRRPIADNIDTSNSGKYCWCQATEHQQMSDTSNTWVAPFQKIYAKYVYLKPMDNDCTNSCAAYCSYMATNLILDGSLDNPVIGEELRATIYDSLLDCIPTEHKITYKSDGEIIDYQYYTGSVKLKAALEKPGFYFKGWCLNSSDCTSPMAAESTKSGWTGQKTLYAQWERTSCGEGVKSEYRDKTLYCSMECEDGYEEQFNPFSAKYDTYVSSEVNYCARTGNSPEMDGEKWYASFSGLGYGIKGYGYCSQTKPDLQNLPVVRDEKCHELLNPIFESIDMENTGQSCWCQATEYVRLVANQYIPKGTLPLNSNFVYAGEIYNCKNACDGICAGIAAHNTFTYDGVPYASSNNHSLLISIYRSVKRCSKKHYTLTLKNGGSIVDNFNNYAYTVTDPIELPTLPEQSGLLFAGWCENLSNCTKPMIGTVTGLFGDKTLYAKWETKSESEISQIIYETNGGVLPEGAPTVALRNSTVTLVPTQSDTLVFEGWYDNPNFNGTPIDVLHVSSSQTGNITLYAKQSTDTQGSSGSGSSSGSNPGSGSSSGSNTPIAPSTPISCANGYNKNPSNSGVLDPSINASTFAYLSGNGQSKKLDDLLSNVKENSTNSRGKWGAVFSRNSQTNITSSNYLFKIYGTSSCNTSDGETPPDGLTYSMLSNVATTAGGNCWCKTTEFTMNGYSAVNISSASPWVYLKTYSESTGSTGCESDCAKDCAMEAKKSAFFRSHVFGDYSACKAATYNIDYEPNGGNFDDGTDIPNQYTIAYKDITAPTSLSKENYNFDAWCEDSNLKTGCSAQKTIPTGSYGNKTLYARWTPVKYDINYNLPGDASWPINSTHPDKYSFGSELTISNPIRNGYNFAGWCINNNSCSDDQLQKTFVITQQTSGPVNLYSYWTEATYTIRYKTMNGTEIFGLTPNEYTFNTETNLPADVIMDNYNFNSWHKTQDTGSDVVTTVPAGTYGPQTFYAEMIAKQYGITYHDGATTITDFPEQYAEYTYGTGISLPETATKEHYNFVGWYDNADLTGNAITQISTTNSGNQEIWAKWEPKTYTITYYWDSTKEEVATENSYTVETENITSLPELSKTHFRFDGWRDNDGNSITEINTANGGDLEFYAAWTRISCENGHYLTDGNCNSCPEEYPYANGANATTKDECYAMCPASLTCPENSVNCVYDDNVNESNINYYHEDSSPCGIVYNCKPHYQKTNAACEPDTYTITYYDGNKVIDADHFNLPKSYTYSENTILPQTPTKPHYAFVGWFRDADLTDGVVTNILDTDYGNKVFYAKWDAEDYHIEFTPGTAGTRTTGFSGTMQNKPVHYGEDDIILPANGFSIDGYEFKEWLCTSKTDTDEHYAEIYRSNTKIVKYTFVDIMICEAQWKPKTYTMSYDCGDGELSDGQDASATFDYDAPYVLTPSVCKTRDNYTLSGWTCTNNFDTTNLLWNIPQNTTCTAHWGNKKYHIKYLESDETVVAGMEPTYYMASMALKVPTTQNPTREHFRFDGWCDDKNLTTNCRLTRIIPVGTNLDPKIFYAKWVATECEAGQYLEDGVCMNCPFGYYTDDGWDARPKKECYFDWDCGDICPTGASECTFASGAQSGRVYWGEDANYSCDIDIRCKSGYNKYTNDAGRPDCALVKYKITYYNVDDTDWGTLDHPDFYNVNDPAITIGALTRDGYIFAGWCEGEDGCEMPLKVFPINPATMSLHNIKLYAQWTENQPQTPEPEEPTEFVCTSGSVLHIGDDTLCLSTTPVGKPALGFGNSNKKYYLQMTKKNAGSNGLNINKNSRKQLNILYNGAVYNVHDASVGNN